MGSNSDWPTLSQAAEIMKDFGVPHKRSGVRPSYSETMYDYAKTAKERGLKCIIAGAGGAAHLPGMVSALTTLRCLGSR